MVYSLRLPFLLSCALAILGIAAHAEAETKLYWSNQAANLIERANPDGTNREIVTFGQRSDYHLSIDTINKKLYWGQSSPCRIMRSDFDGANIELVILDTNTGCEFGAFTVDPDNGFIILSRNSGGWGIYRYDLDDGANETFISGTRIHAGGIDERLDQLVVDPIRQRMYYTPTANPLSVARRNYDGTGHSVLFSKSPLNGFIIDGIAVDPVNEHFYYIRTSADPFLVWNGSIQRRDLDGGNQITIGSNLFGRARGLTVDSQNGRYCYTFTFFLISPGPASYVTCHNFAGSQQFQYDANRGSPHTYRIVVDPDSQTLFWSYTGGGTVGERNIDFLVNTQTPLQHQSVHTTRLRRPMSLHADYDDGSLFIIDTDLNQILSTTLLGNDHQVRVTGLNNPRDISLDLTEGKIYWLNGGTEEIRRADRDGSNNESFTPVDSSARRLALDPINRKLIWSQLTRFFVYDLETSDITSSPNIVAADYRGLSLDPFAQLVYYYDASINTLLRTHYDTTGTEPVLAQPGGDSIEFDPSSSDIYISYPDFSSILRRNVVDSAIASTVTGNSVAGDTSLSRRHVAQIQVFGNSIPLSDQQTTTNEIDHTEFVTAHIGGESTRVFEIRNAGLGSLVLDSDTPIQLIGPEAGDFAVTMLPEQTTLPGVTRSFEITFSPTGVGTRNATIVVTPSSPLIGQSFSFAISGEAVAPEMTMAGGALIPDGDTDPSLLKSNDFGEVNIHGNTQTNQFTITNIGGYQLELTGDPVIHITGTHASDFTVQQLPATLISANGGTSSFQIRFNPSAAGERNALVSIETSILFTTPFTFAIRGVGITPAIEVTGNSLVIANGSVVPTAANHTLFGAASVPNAGTIVRSFSVENTGSDTLSLTGTPRVAISGAAAGDFTVSAQPDPSLEAGENSSFTVSFTPTAVENRDAVITIQSNDANANPYTFAIRGVGIQQEIQIEGNGQIIASGSSTPTETNHTEFGSVNLASGSSIDRSFTIRNVGTDTLELTGTPRVALSGTNAADFSVVSTPNSPLAESATTSFTIRFTPSDFGLHSAIVTVLSNDPQESSYSFTIQGTSIQQEIQLRGNSVVLTPGQNTASDSDNTLFPEVNVSSGATVDRSFSIDNIGTDTLELTGTPLVSISGAAAGDFSVSASPSGTLLASQSSGFTIRFNPSAVGTRDATVSIASNDPDYPTFQFAIQGTGIEQELALLGRNDNAVLNGGMPSTVNGTDFGSVSVAHGTESVTFTISNSGTDTLQLTGTPPVSVSGTHASDFTVDVQPATSVDAGDTTTFIVTFDSSAVGARSALIGFASNHATDNPFVFEVQGSGISPIIGVSGLDVAIPAGDTNPQVGNNTDFGEVSTADQSTTHVFSIGNSGTDTLVLASANSVQITGLAAADFEVISQPTELNIPVDEEELFSIRFIPSEPGARNATVVISSDDLQNPTYSFAITGFGTQPLLIISGNNNPIVSGSTTVDVNNFTDFGNVRVLDETVSRTYSIRNTGTEALELNEPLAVQVVGQHPEDFTVQQPELLTLAPNESTEFTVVFNPSLRGTREAELEIASNDLATELFTFAIAGFGTAPTIEIAHGGTQILNGDTNPSLAKGTDFGTRNVVSNEEVVRTFSINNLGDIALELTGAPRVRVVGSASADFSIVSNPNSSVQVGAPNTAFAVRFSPQGFGLRSATVEIETNDPDAQPFSFAVLGRGDSDADSDGDGVSDLQEILDNSDPLDPGSVLVVGDGSICFHWNGFLEQLHQIIEVSNAGSASLDLEFTLSQQDGSVSDQLNFSLAANLQRDLILNDLPGFSPQTIGLACVEVKSGNPQDLRAALSVYRFTQSGYLFAYNVPELTPWNGPKYGTYNTYALPFIGAPADGFVANWLEITNAEAISKSGTVHFYSLDGVLLDTERVTLGSRQRQDISMHFGGSGTAGKVGWVPDDPEAKFWLRRSRYYLDAAGITGSLEGLWNVASLPMAQGTGGSLAQVIDTRDATVIAEIANSLDEPIEVAIEVRGEEGALTQLQFATLNLPADGSQHIVLNSVLAGQLGSLTLRANKRTSLTVSILTYKQDTDGAIRYVTATSSKEAFVVDKQASYNSFLGQRCALLIHNRVTEGHMAQLFVTRFDGTILTENEPLVLLPLATREIDICGRESMEAYGQVRLETDAPQQLIGIIERRSREGGAGLVFSAGN